MFQLEMDQRQSCRVERRFLVTDFDDLEFSEPFDGHDVNLTGLGFWINDADWFLPGQEISLRVKNLDDGETYSLNSVKVVHIQQEGERFLCGCHIVQITSSQLLSHHRLVITDAATAEFSLNSSEMDEFNFIEEGSPLSTEPSDLQEASLALDLAVAEMQAQQSDGDQLVAELVQQLKWRLQPPTEPLNASEQQDLLRYIIEQIESFGLFFKHSGQSAMALSILAKLIAHTPLKVEDREDWKTMLSDFERRFISEKMQVAFDFMHQGVAPHDAMLMAEKYLQDKKID